MGTLVSLVSGRVPPQCHPAKRLLGKKMVNNPSIRPYFQIGVAFGWVLLNFHDLNHFDQSPHGNTICEQKIGEANFYLESLVYHFFRQLWLVLGVKLMEINGNWFFR